MNMNENIQALLRVLDPKDNTTGGGTASSIAGAMAAGLAGMVARLSVGKTERSEDYYVSIAEETVRLSDRLFTGGSEDAAAFDRVSSAYKMPKTDEQDKALRSTAIQEAMVFAAEVPLFNAESCRRVLEICSDLRKSYNTNAASDLECAEYLAKAGLKGCAANVRINLASIKDNKVKCDFETRLESYLQGV